MTSLFQRTKKGVGYIKIIKITEGLRRLAKFKSAIFSLIVILFLVCSAIFADLLAPYDPIAQNLPERNRGPSLAHLMGTDHMGRDIFSRILYGARISLYIGFLAVLIGVGGGTLIGCLAGYYGGKVDMIIMRFMDILFAFPGILLAIAMVAFVGPNITNVIIVLGFVRWAGYARLVRGEFLSLKERDFVEAARVIGASDYRIIFHHILPNAISPIIVSATLSIGVTIISAASLSFLGLGVQPPTPEWGLMLADARGFLYKNPYGVVFPGFMIFVSALAFALLGDGLDRVMEARA